MSKNINLLAQGQDPIFIGTGGFTIGRVDNTIVRDPITMIPKIPGTSIAGTWRYYTALTLHSYFKEKYRLSRQKRKEVDNKRIELYDNSMNGWEDNKDWIFGYEDNRYAAIKCAGQDEKPNQSIDEAWDEEVTENTGHCGRCIVCRAFGYSKQTSSRIGMVHFSDLNILLFPVCTRLGTKWITSERILRSAGIEAMYKPGNNDRGSNVGEVGICSNSIGEKIEHLNLGWLNFKAVDKSKEIGRIVKCLQNDPKGFEQLGIQKRDLVLVSDEVIQQIINSNLEIRTSVAINPLTGTAKDGALFTSEAIPRGTVFYGEIRVEGHPLDKGPSVEKVEKALMGGKKYFETLGIGGMTTRGFGRLKVLDWGEKNAK